MSYSVAQSNSPEQDMPSNNLLGWTDGPLPNQQLELAAFELFCDNHPGGLWAERNYKAERDKARRQVIRLYARFLANDRWGVENAHERLAMQLMHVIFGERRLGPTIRQEVLDYCEAFMADAWGHFRKRLFYPNEVDANALEVASEDASADAPKKAAVN